MPDPTPTATPEEPGLTTQSITGALWFLLQTVAVKSSSIVALIALAYLLVPEDFGLIGLALSVTAFANVLYQTGLAQVVVQRRQDLNTTEAAVFWLSLAMGTAAAILLVLCAPLIEIIFDAPGVGRLITVLAVAVPLNSASVIPRVRLISDLRFARIATISGVQVVAQTALSVLFAALGLGAMSLALPIPIVACGVLFWFSRYAPLQATWPPKTTAWRALSKSAGALISTSWLDKIVEYGDYLVLGLFTNPITVGLYFFAFRLSTQSATVFADNVGRVMFPTLVKLPRGSPRQLQAFARASRAFAGTGIPFAAFFVFYGPDVVYLLFGPEWQDAAVFVQLLSVAAVFRTVGNTSRHLLLAQGRYAEMLRWNTVGTVGFLCLVVLGGAVWGALGVCAAVVLHAALDGWIRYYLTIRPFGGRISEFGRLLAGPIVTSTLIIGASLAVAVFALHWTNPSWARLALGLGSMVLLYLPILRLIDQQTSLVLQRIISQVLAPLRTRLKRRPGGAAGSRL